MKTSTINLGLECDTAVDSSTTRLSAVEVRIANRIDIGGFTDIYHSKNGAVFIIAIEIGGRPIGVKAAVTANHNDGLKVTVNRKSDSELWRAVAQKVITRLGIRSNVAFEIDIATPPGCGAGVSSQVSAAIVAALATTSKLDLTREQIWIEAYRAETELTGCGWQDQGPIAIGGCALITADPATSADYVTPIFESISVSDDIWEEFQRRGLVVWTGESHFSKNSLDDVKDRLLRGESKAHRAWDKLCSLAHRTRDLLFAGGPPNVVVDKVAAIIADNWDAEIELTPMVTTKKLITLGETLRELGGYKLLGAGRGGFLFWAIRKMRQRPQPACWQKSQVGNSIRGKSPSRERKSMLFTADRQESYWLIAREEQPYLDQLPTLGEERVVNTAAPAMYAAKTSTELHGSS